MIHAASSCLILIDLQHGIVGMDVAPHPSAQVVERGAKLAERFRSLGSLVVLVRVAFSDDGKDILRPETDNPPVSSDRPTNWSELVTEVGPVPGDLVITKHQWGAFHGTELDLQLRRRGVKTIVIGGISTNYGVESTARAAYELGYNLVFVEDAMAGPSAEAHAFPFKYVFPRLGKIRSTEQTLNELA